MANGEQQGQQSGALAPDQAVQRIWIPNPARGFATTAPERALLPGTDSPLWRDMHWMDIENGYLQSSPGLGLTFTPNPGTLDVAQRPVEIFHQAFSLGAKDIWVIVTTQEIHHYNGSSWTNLTPTYTTGTVDTDSTAVITGNGTTWSSRKIKPGMIIDIEDNGTWHTIQSVDSETQITLTAAYPSTLSGQDYTIRRLFLSDARPRIQASIFNNNLYVSVSAQNLAYILRYEDIWRDYAWGAGTYLVANEALTPAVDVISEVEHFRGHLHLNDGRIIVAAHVDDGSTEITNRLYYSSHVDQTVWLNEPGGFVDLVGMNGRVTALGRLGEDVTVHFDRGIMLASETGESEPPLTYDIVPFVTRGCTEPRSLRALPIGEIFYSQSNSQDTVQPSGQIYVFDGNALIPVGETIYGEIEGASGNNQDSWGWVWTKLDSHRSKCRMFISDSRVSAGTTRELVLHWDDGYWVQKKWFGQITAGVDDEPILGGTASTTRVSTGNFIFEEEASPPITSNYDPGGGMNGAPYLYTDWLDAGKPGFDKTWTQVLVWVAGGEAQDIKCQLLSRDNRTSDAITISYTTADTLTTADDGQILHFSFTPFQAEAVQVQLTFNPPIAQLFLSPRVNHIAVDFAVIGQVEAVEGVAH